MTTWIIVGVVILGVLGYLLKRHADNRHDPTLEEIDKIITNFLQGTGGEWEWDDFTGIPLRDPKLDKIREEYADLQYTYRSKVKTEYCSKEGIEVLKKLHEQIKKDLTTAAANDALQHS
jgi:hypothetical protein